MKKIKVLGVLAIIILGVFAYLISRPSPPLMIEEKKPIEEKEEIKEEKIKKPEKLIYRLNTTSPKSPHPGKQVVEIREINLKSKATKLLFTDIDENFQIRLTNGLFPETLLIFGTTLHETRGSIWEIKIDGSGRKREIIPSFFTSAFTSDGKKIAFTTYDQITGLYNLWLMEMDGRFKKKILESETLISDPLFLEEKLAFIKMDKEGNSQIKMINFDGSNEEEILKSESLLHSLSFSANKFAYIKSPKAAGKENQAEVYIFDLIKKSEKRITQDNQADGYPVLSKDGSKIAFVKNGKIWLSKTDGEDQKVLTEGTQPLGFL